MNNQHISGSGTISSGEYNEVHVSGSGKSDGFIRCNSLKVSGGMIASGDIEVNGTASVSGSFKGTSLVCDLLKTSGNITLDNDCSCNGFKISGSGKIKGDVICSGAGKVSGGITCGGKLHCEKLSVSGGAKVTKDVEAEDIKISGGIRCDDTVNGEKITISGGGHATFVGGSWIMIGDTWDFEPETFKYKIMHLLSFCPFPMFTAEESIEGDELYLAYTKAKAVRGSKVVIGRGCIIDTVQYTDELDIHPSAKIGNIEKL